MHDGGVGVGEQIGTPGIISSKTSTIFEVVRTLRRRLPACAPTLTDDITQFVGRMQIGISSRSKFWWRGSGNKRTILLPLSI